jgi:transposase
VTADAAAAPVLSADQCRGALEAAGIQFVAGPRQGPAVRLRDGDRRLRSKMAPHHVALADHLAAPPGATLAELRAWMLEKRGVAVSIATVRKPLQRLGLSPRNGTAGGGS